MTWLALPLVFFSLSLFAAIDTFEFRSEEQRQLFRQLSQELRCPKCQNQNLAGSNSAIALDLRKELHSMVVSGKDTRQIKAFMVERYGQFVLYKPGMNSMTYALWYGPFALLLIGLLIVFSLGKKSKKLLLVEETTQGSIILDDQKKMTNHSHQKRIKELLEKNDD
jgi:cytochrome c-type biogenesis protein CcmH